MTVPIAKSITSKKALSERLFSECLGFPWPVPAWEEYSVHNLREGLLLRGFSTGVIGEGLVFPENSPSQCRELFLNHRCRMVGLFDILA